MLLRPEVGTIEHIRMWIDAKDATERYEWLSADCPAGLYAREHDIPIRDRMMDRLNDLAQSWPHTWGALSERARR
jgi:hypothetical protein